MDHSVAGYLNRRSTEELELILMKIKDDESYSEYLEMVEEILKTRRKTDCGTAQ